MGVAGYNVKLSVAGQPTAVTGEAMGLVSGTTYQITDADRQIIDPRVTPVIYENGVPTVQNVTIDYLRGTVAFPVAPTAPVTADVTYLPKIEVGIAQSFSLTRSRTSLETTGFQHGSSGPHKTFIQGLKMVEVSFNHLSISDNLYGTTKLSDLVDGTDTDGFGIIEILIGSTWSFRAFMLPSSHETTANVDELVEASMDWMLASPEGIAGEGFSIEQ